MVLGYKAWLFIFLLLSFFLLERLWPELRQRLTWANLRRWGRNYALLVINTALAAGIVIPLTLVAADWGPNWRSGWELPLLAELSIDLLLLDLFIYCWHRVNHELPFLWRFHQVHHLDRQMDSSSAVRFHFVEVLLSALARALLMLALDISFYSVVVFEIVFAAAVIYQHSNLQLSNNSDFWLAKVIITPRLHWTHHHQRLPYTNSNYGSIFSFWDRMFGSLRALPAAKREHIPIGLDSEPDLRLDKLLAKPFTKRSHRHDR